MNNRSTPLSRAQTDLCRRLNYVFSEPALFERALTHRSFSSNHYERLEFLGDSILNFAIATDLYNRFPDLAEGELTRMRASLVKQETLAKLARELALGDSLMLGSGEMKSGGFDRESILADALEAVFGAIFLDGGIDAVRTLIAKLYSPYLDALNPQTVPKDPKTQLQEYLQKQALPTPVYSVLELSGDPHNQLFIVECQLPVLALSTRGKGNSRRAAEQQAARHALEQLNQP